MQHMLLNGITKQHHQIQAQQDQESLIHILQNRLRDQKRTELIRDVQAAQQEFAQGQCQPLTPEQIMEEILS